MARSIHDNKLQFSESAIFHDPEPRFPTTEDQPEPARLGRRQIARGRLGRAVRVRMIMADQPVAPRPLGPERREQGAGIDLECVLWSRGDVGGWFGAKDPARGAE